MKHDTSGGFLLINFRNPLMPGGKAAGLFKYV